MTRGIKGLMRAAAAFGLLLHLGGCTAAVWALSSEEQRKCWPSGCPTADPQDAPAPDSPADAPKP